MRQEKHTLQRFPSRSLPAEELLNFAVRGTHTEPRHVGTVNGVCNISAPTKWECETINAGRRFVESHTGTR